MKRIMERKKPKRRRFIPGDIVRHGNQFGCVTGTHEGIEVVFPSIDSSLDHKRVNFHPDGSLLGGEDPILFFHERQSQALNNYCRSLSCKVREVNIRIMHNKKDVPEILEEQENEAPDEDENW